jgi:hypothetical protein
MTKDSNENIYCDIKVKIFRFFNKYLHEPLFLELVIVIIFFLQSGYMNTAWRITPESYGI